MIWTLLAAVAVRFVGTVGAWVSDNAAAAVLLWTTFSSTLSTLFLAAFIRPKFRPAVRAAGRIRAVRVVIKIFFMALPEMPVEAHVYQVFHSAFGLGIGAFAEAYKHGAAVYGQAQIIG